MRDRGAHRRAPGRRAQGQARQLQARLRALAQRGAIRQQPQFADAYHLIAAMQVAQGRRAEAVATLLGERWQRD